jgi:chromosome segregation ATPase
MPDDRVAQREIEQLRAQVELLTSSQSSVHGEIAEVKHQMLSKTAEASAARKERDSAISRAAAAEEQVSQVKQAHEELADALRIAQSSSNEMQSECSALHTSLENLKLELEAVKTRASEGQAREQQKEVHISKLRRLEHATADAHRLQANPPLLRILLIEFEPALLVQRL